MCSSEQILKLHIGWHYDLELILNPSVAKMEKVKLLADPCVKDRSVSIHSQGSLESPRARMHFAAAAALSAAIRRSPQKAEARHDIFAPQKQHSAFPH